MGQTRQGNPFTPPKIDELGLKNNDPFKLDRFQPGPFNPLVKRANPRG